MANFGAIDSINVHHRTRNAMPRPLSRFLLPLLCIVAALPALAVLSVFAAELPPQPVANAAPDPSVIAPYQARFGRQRPIVAVVGQNDGTEVVDFMIPYGILSHANAAEVLAVATEPGPLKLRPALQVQPHATTAQFDERFPDGADYVIVPAVVKTDDPALLAWITAQAGKGSTIVSICDGALVVAKAGLFKGHRATGHWATQAQRERDFPDTQWLKNIRYVADGKRISSAGVSAAIPTSLALVEAIAGHERAVQVAHELGANDWSARHDSEHFHVGAGLYLTGARNMLFSSRHDIGLPVAEGADDIALALAVDAFSRTHRVHAYSVADSMNAIRTRHGLTLLPDRKVDSIDTLDRMLPPFDGTPSLQALDKSLEDIGARYGKSTAELVVMELEYPYQQ
jgi:putative intracellular protease/amidase